MSHPLDGPWRKIERADDHLKSINNQITAWMSFDPPTPFRQRDRQTGQDFYGIILNPPIPKSIGLVVGDFVHNLRSALDHLIWQLVIVNRAKPDRHTAFPILDDLSFVGDKPAFFKRTEAQIGKCAAAAQNVIESLQPYHRGHPYRISQHPLWLLYELDIIDKHRLIALIGGHYTREMNLGADAEISLDDLVLPVSSMIESAAFDDYVVFGKLGPDGQPQGNFKPEITIRVAFRDQEGIRGDRAAASGQPFDILEAMLDYVRLEVMPRFAGFFP